MYNIYIVYYSCPFIWENISFASLVVKR
jgi:hypothetical protein